MSIKVGKLTLLTSAALALVFGAVCGPSAAAAPAGTPSPVAGRFPNTTDTVKLLGIDPATHMERFQVAKPDGTGKLVVDPATYRLPLAATVAFSVPYQLCNPQNTGSCDNQSSEMDNYVHDSGPNTFSKINVNAKDEIDSVSKVN